MGPENNVGLEGCWTMECLLPYLCMVTVPHIMVGLERMLDYMGVGLARFHCILILYNLSIFGIRRLHAVSSVYSRSNITRTIQLEGSDKLEGSDRLEVQY